MNDAELDKMLKAARGPDLGADYVEDFPRMVLANLRSTPAPVIRARQSWRPRLFSILFLARRSCELPELGFACSTRRSGREGGA